MTAPIQRDRTALIVVDMQNGFCDPAGSAAQVGFDISMCRAAIEPCVRLVEAARAHDIPVIFTRLVYRADYRDGGVVTDEILQGLVEAQCCAALMIISAIMFFATRKHPRMNKEKNYSSARPAFRA